MSEQPPLRVVHLVESLGSGGAERALYNVLQHLDPARIQSTVMTVYDTLDFWVEPIRRLGIDVHTLGCPGHRHLWRGVQRMKAWLRAHPHDLVHTQLFPANLIGRTAAKSVGVPVISTIQALEYAPESWRGPSLRAKRVVARAIDGWTARRSCRELIAISEGVRQNAHRDLRFPLERIEVIPNSIECGDLDAFAPVDIRDLLGFSKETLVLLNVGRVVPEKGLEYAIAAMPAILARHPNAQFVSAGAIDREWHAHLQSVIAQHGVAKHVHFLGERRDIPALLRACDLFVFPSVVEGLGVALLEAMAVGCAAVASDIPTVAEFVRHGENGWLSRVKDPAALAEAVLHALRDEGERNAIRAKAKESVRARFASEAVAGQLTRFYQRATRDTATRPTAP
ncbi:MAG: glycosyltransferase family 4 protein [Acidobacteriota bacterium]|nr:glycosyltransferase family 4 protein [Acidobacteriota bacterium]